MDANPTREWARDPKAELILDLDNITFLGTKIGDSYTALSFLGPCEKYIPMIINSMDTEGLGKREKSYGLSYHSHGLGFSTDRTHRIESFHVYVQPDPYEPGSKAFAGKVIWNGELIDLASVGNVDSFIKTFGAPDQDEEEPERDHLIPALSRRPYRRYMFYDKPNAMWMINVDKLGHTKAISVSRPREAQLSRTSPGPSETE